MGLLKCDHNKGLITLTLITLYYVLNILEGVFVRYESFFFNEYRYKIVSPSSSFCENVFHLIYSKSLVRSLLGGRNVKIRCLKKIN